MARTPDEPRIELVTNEPEVHSEGQVATSVSGRVWLLAIVGAICAVVAVVAISGGDDSEDDAAPSPTTNRDASTPSTVPPTLAPGIFETGSGPLLGRRFDASLLLGGGDDPWRLVDLSTGTIRPVPPLDGVPAHAVVPVRGGMAVLERSFDVPMLIRAPAGEAGSNTSVAELATELDGVRLDGTAVGLLAGGDADHVWILHTPLRSPAGARLQATLVDLDGDLVVGPVPVPGTPVAATERHVVFDVGGRTFLAGEDGIEDLGPGTAYDASARLVARVGCDDTAMCAAQTVDVGTGEISVGRPLSTQAASDGRVLMVLSRQGGLATVPDFFPVDDPGSTPPAQLLVTPAAGETVAVDLPSLRAAPAWLPHGDGLVVLTDIGIQHVSIEGPLLAMRRIDGFDVGDATALFVVPH